MIALCLAYRVNVCSSGLKERMEAEKVEGESAIDLREYAIIDLALAIVRHRTEVRTCNHGVIYEAYISDC